MEKLTDEYIIANYENYIKDGCNNIEKDLLDLAKRQKAEIERLEDDKNRLEKIMDNLSKDLDAQMIRNF